MTRLKVSIVILLILIIYSIMNFIIVNHKCSTLIEMLEETKVLYDKDKEKAEEKANEISEYWNKTEKILQFLVPAGDISEISVYINKADQLISDDVEETDAELDSAIENIVILREKNKPF